MTTLQRPSVPSGGQHASGRGWERPPVASEAQSAPVPPRTYSQAASRLPAQSSQYWFSIYALGKLLSCLAAQVAWQPHHFHLPLSRLPLQMKWLFRKSMRARRVRKLVCMRASISNCCAVRLSYEDLWEALQLNGFVVEATIDHLMAQMASHGL